MASSSTTLVIDINHPYYLSTSDHPGLSLVSEVLTDQNYHHWSRSVSIALSAKLKLGFIDGSQVKPAANSPLLVLWMHSNDLIWDDLHHRYAQNNVPRLFSIRKELSSLTQGTKSVTTYFTKFRGLMDELDNLAPIPRCVCQIPACNCQHTQKLTQYEQLMKLSQFLMGLNEQFTSIRGQILLMSPLPDLSHAYAMLLQEENQRESVNHTGFLPENAAMNVKFGNKPKFVKKDDRKSENTSVVCDYCKFTGHSREKYFALHGYPEWHRLYGQPKPKVKPKKTNQVVNLAQNSQNFSDVVSQVSSTDSLSETQCQQLISMLQAKLPSHTANYAPWLNTDVSQCAEIHLPNGNISIVSHIGTVQLTPEIQLRDVLVALASKMEKEIGELEEDLYKLYSDKLQHTHVQVHSATSIQGHHWHWRLGHPSNSKDKFAAKTLKCVFIGYPFNKKGYRVLDISSKKCYITRDIVFVEDCFPFHNKTFDTVSTSLSISSTYIFPDTPLFTDDNVISVQTMPSSIPHISSPYIDNNSNTHVVNPSSSSIPVAQTRPVRTRTVPSKFKDYTGFPLFNKHQSTPSAGALSGTSFCAYPLHNYMSYQDFSSSYYKYLCATVVIPTPYTYQQAATDSKWLAAMKLELHALESNHTWELVPKPAHTHIVDCKWLFKVKYNSDGTVERYKARLVARGFTQTFGLDYFETFAPVAKMTTVRILIAIAAAQGWSISQLDITNLSSIPVLNVIKNTSDWVCRLKKSIYGLKQAPRCWFTKYSDALKYVGYKQSHSDNSLFTLHTSSQFVAILVYVDDILVTGSTKSAIQQGIDFFSTRFKVKDLGDLKYFLGVEVARSSAGIYLNQRKYTLDILADSGLLGAKPSKIPKEQNHNLQQNTSMLLSDSECSTYRRIVGGLLYLTVTRPDLSYVVHVLSQFIAKPRIDHLHAAYKVIKYLKGSPGQGLLMSATSKPVLTVFCDSDWGGCQTTRHSLTGYFVKFGESLISWKCKKQHTVFRSSAEAEYRCMADTCCELVWLLTLFQTFGYYNITPVTLFCDSKSALYIASNSVFHERTKHIEHDCHIVREKIQLGVITNAHISTTSQPADIFTKVVSSSQLQFLISKLGVCNLFLPSNLRGMLQI
ncbi:uncharacterized protein LOC141696596 [Apium graveolens]|uniref:uncharacterized protein LOC141696596 n=1 Tax=Apium graveolens TaxID=4045 RepID=UPI003D79BF3A